MGDPQVWCTACKGTGRAPLPRELADTLAFVRARREATAPEVHLELMKGEGSPTAATNRLVKLLALGFLETSGKSGKAPIYVPAGRKAKR